jgi:hypothetical protein
VSCYNRAREVLRGRNAKGKPPVIHPPLEPRRVAYCAAGEVRELRRELTVSTTELVVELMRDSRHRVVFGLGVVGRG